MEQTSEVSEQPKLTWGIVAFATMLFVPFVAAIIIYLGAFIVSGEVYAAEAATQNGAAGVVVENDVAGWKHSLVGICPLH